VTTEPAVKQDTEWHVETAMCVMPSSKPCSWYGRHHVRADSRAQQPLMHSPATPKQVQPQRLRSCLGLIADNPAPRVLEGAHDTIIRMGMQYRHCCTSSPCTHGTSQKSGLPLVNTTTHHSNTPPMFQTRQQMCKQPSRRQLEHTILCTHLQKPSTAAKQSSQAVWAVVSSATQRTARSSPA
jgi:hypothetical protein